MNLTLDDLRSGRVKLQFGNPEQIAVLEAERRRQEEAEQRALERGDAETNPDVLKCYEVFVEGTFSCTVNVDAYDEEEAEEKARSEWHDGDIDYDLESVSIESVERSPRHDEKRDCEEIRA